MDCALEILRSGTRAVSSGFRQVEGVAVEKFSIGDACGLVCQRWHNMEAFSVDVGVLRIRRCPVKRTNPKSVYLDFMRPDVLVEGLEIVV